MAIRPPQLPLILLAVERRLSPQVESLLRTDVAQDGIAVANGLVRLVTMSVRDLGTNALEAFGLPSGRQVSRLQRSIDTLATAIAATAETPADSYGRETGAVT
jgi:hypothetical protein